ncbi:cell division protein ZapE [Elioraea rosea]|uniref:cell division protein ZapE n=1 Tax=Elioraea rosea TaxID=2492390 RepID=UPI0011838338|nr:cell division protein ZapE [Elioraea rosea]
MDAATDSATAQGPLPAWRARVARGELMPDTAQEFAAERLQGLWRALAGYAPPAPQLGQGGLLSAFRARLGFGRSDGARQRRVREDGTDVPQGLYLVGSVGRGKSMLMDLFFVSAPTERRRRVHFHAFMQEVQRFLHAHRQRSDEADPIPALADQVAERSILLCFDEFQVHDIADAMILGRLFEALFARGVIVVATSNTVPDELYRDGLQRERFLPFIAVIKERLEVIVLDGGRDYRRDRILGMRTWWAPADARADAALGRTFEELAGEGSPAPLVLEVLGRRVTLPLALNHVARADFEALCGVPLGPADYLALATHLHALVLDDIPRLSPQNFDRARRFITLIDALYEHRVKLVASAADIPDRLYERGENASMFQRTASRLMEMQSEDYLALPHLT